MIYPRALLNIFNEGKFPNVLLLYTIFFSVKSVFFESLHLKQKPALNNIPIRAFLSKLPFPFVLLFYANSTFGAELNEVLQ